MQSPVIGVSSNVFPAEDRHFYKMKELEYGDASIAIALRKAGATPLMFYRAGEVEDEAMRTYATSLMPLVQGLVLTGGADVSPTHYGESALKEAWRGDALRDRWEMTLYHAAVAAGRPVLGICRGAQVMNVAEGGSLWQDLPSLRPNTEVHRSQEEYCKRTHGIRLGDGSLIASLFGQDELRVNSVHHQGLRRVPEVFTPTAWSPDGIVEAIERSGTPWVLGVQWHPEWMEGVVSQERIFTRFVHETSQVTR